MATVKKMATVKINKKGVKEAIIQGDTYSGKFMMAVSPNGETQIHWAEKTRQWNPWGDDDFVIEIPALFADGSGEESELAFDCLMDNLGHSKANKVKDGIYDATFDLVEYADKKFPEWMKAAREDLLDWLLQAFLDACNGDGGDLNDQFPWGATRDSWGNIVEAIQPPFKFKYNK